jgi:hypothetical protein
MLVEPVLLLCPYLNRRMALLSLITAVLLYSCGLYCKYSHLIAFSCHYINGNSPSPSLLLDAKSTRNKPT